jgi:hypothetical protein
LRERVSNCEQDIVRTTEYVDNLRIFKEFRFSAQKHRTFSFNDASIGADIRERTTRHLPSLLAFLEGFLDAV